MPVNTFDGYYYLDAPNPADAMNERSSFALKTAQKLKPAVTTAGVTQAASTALADRNQGILNYNADRAYFYSGQAAANNAKMDAYSTNLNFVTQDRNRYAQVFKPLEDRLASLAVPTADQYNQATGKASADVNQSFAGATAELTRSAGRFGINPSSGRFNSLMSENGLKQTAALTGAMANARAGVDARADNALKVGLDVGTRYRQTQQLTGPNLLYNVMGARQANGLEGELSQFAIKADEMQNKASQSVSDKAWAYFMGTGKSSGGGGGGSGSKSRTTKAAVTSEPSASLRSDEWGDAAA